MKYVITGINGLLGQTIASMIRRYVLPTDDIAGIGKGASRLSSIASPSSIDYIETDITDDRSLVGILSKNKFDVIIHAASMTNVDACEQEQKQATDINVRATSVLVEEAVKKNPDVFILYVSTDFVFDGLKEIYTEEDDPSPVNFYGETKAQAERIIQNAAPRWAIARPSLVYGHPRYGGKKDIVRWVKEEVEKGAKIKLVNDQYRKPTYAEDLAWAIIQLSLNRMQGIYHVCGGDAVTPYQIGTMTVELMSKNAERYIEKTNSATLNQAAKRPPSTILSIEKIKSAIGYKPISLKKGIKRTISLAQTT